MSKGGGSGVALWGYGATAGGGGGNAEFGIFGGEIGAGVGRTTWASLVPVGEGSRGGADDVDVVGPLGEG